MRKALAMWGAAALGAAVGCGGAAEAGRGTLPPSETSSEGTPERMAPPGTTIAGQAETGSAPQRQGPVPSRSSMTDPTVTSSQIITGTFACLLRPIRDEHGAYGVGGGPAPAPRSTGDSIRSTGDSMRRGEPGQQTTAHGSTDRGYVDEDPSRQRGRGHGPMGQAPMAHGMMDRSKRRIRPLSTRFVVSSRRAYRREARSPIHRR